MFFNSSCWAAASSKELEVEDSAGSQAVQGKVVICSSPAGPLSHAAGTRR